MPDGNWIERLLSHDRAVVLSMLSVVIAASWAYILAGAGTGMNTFDMTSLSIAAGMPGQGPMSMEMTVTWASGYAFVMFLMWWTMMVAMMLPSAAPVILLHARIARGAGPSGDAAHSLFPTIMFSSGYLLVWGIFSALAATLEWILVGAGLLSPMTLSGSGSLFAGAVLCFAGAYQFSPVKQACLRHCQGPVQFLSRYWQAGARGALRMGLRHGIYCLGCCWGLMMILFFGGIMNLYWIAGLAFLVLLEKVLPVGRKLTYLSGSLLVIWGLSFLYRGIA